MELLQWHKVCEIDGDKLRRPPVVALNRHDDHDDHEGKNTPRPLQKDNKF